MVASARRRRRRGRRWWACLQRSEAKKVILKDMPEADVQVVPAGSPMILNLRNDRVVVEVNTVVQAPTVG